MRKNKPASNKYQIQGDLNRIWFKYYTQPITSEQRVKLAEAFIKRYDNGVNPLTTEFQHPQTALQGRYNERDLSLAEILADFILRAEDVNDGTIHSHETQENRKDRRRDKELRIYEEEMDDGAKEAGERMPSHHITQERTHERMNAPRIAESGKSNSQRKVRAELVNVKEYPEYYATSFKEDHGKEYDETIRRIRRLDLNRIRTCVVCGDGFYAHDLRRKVCDRQHGLLQDGTRSKLSMCEINYKNNGEMWRNREKRQ